MIDRQDPAEKKFSEVFLRFVAPLYEGTPKDVTPEYLQHALTVPMTIWNAIVLKEWGRPQDYLAEVYAGLEKAAARDRAVLTEMLHMWVRRKEELFPNERWAIRDLVVYRDFNGELIVRVVAAGPEEHGLPETQAGASSHAPHVH
jgi:hypothetical protein